MKALYEELDLPAAFAQCQEDSYRRISGRIRALAPPLPPALFLELLQKFYQRKK